MQLLNLTMISAAVSFTLIHTGNFFLLPIGLILLVYSVFMASYSLIMFWFRSHQINHLTSQRFFDQKWLPVILLLGALLCMGTGVLLSFFFYPPGEAEFRNGIMWIDGRGECVGETDKITVDMYVSHRTATLHDPTHHYFAGVRKRGSNSLTFAKPQFALEVRHPDGSDNKVTLKGLHRASEYVLNGMAVDPTLMRNVLAYWISAQQGQWAPETKWVELFWSLERKPSDYHGADRQPFWWLSRQYYGIYVLIDRIRSGADFIPLDEDQGGWIVSSFDAKYDDYRPMSAIYTRTDFRTSVYPTDTTKEQEEDINNQIDYFEKVIFGPCAFNHTAAVQSVVHMESFIAYFLHCELTFNFDAYTRSVYIHRLDRNGPFRMGPVWDYDRALGNWPHDIYGVDSYSHNSDYEFEQEKGWLFMIRMQQSSGGVCFWYGRLFQNSSIIQQVQDAWVEGRKAGGPFDIDSILDFVDAQAHLVGAEAYARNWERWTDWLPLFRHYFVALEHDSYGLDHLKSMLRRRIAWLDENIPKLQADMDALMQLSEDNFGWKFKLEGQGDFCPS